MATTLICHVLCWHFLLICLSYGELDRHLMSADDESNLSQTHQEILETPITDSLSNMIAKQTSLCGHSVLCTIETPSTTGQINRACCQSCSCSSDCVGSGTCCLDYAFKSVFGNMTFTNVNGLINTIKASDTVEKISIEKVLENNYMYTTNSSKMMHLYKSKGRPECIVPPTVQTAKLWEPENYYEIVTTCLDEVFDISLVPDRYFDNFPVTSLDTGITYINKLVLACNEQSESPFDYWELYFKCFWSSQRVGFMPIYAPHPLVLLDQLRLHRKCESVFEPSDATRKRHSIHECLKVDTMSCKNDPMSKSETFLNTFCTRERRHINIRIRDKDEWKVYNNVACMMCNSETFNDNVVCKKVTKNDYFKLRINTEGLPEDRVSLDAMADGGLLNTTTADIRVNNSLCSHGYTHIQILDGCRRLYCPRSMYIVNGTCVPLFEQVTGAAFMTVFNISIISPITKDFKKYIFERELLRFLQHDLLNREIVDIEAITILPSMPTYMVEISFAPLKYDGFSLTDAVKAVSSRYYTKAYIRVTNSVLIGIGISPTPAVYFDNTDVRANAVKSIRLDNISSTIPRHFIDISESYKCYRVALEGQDIAWVSKHHYKIIANDLDVYRVDVDWDATNLLVCLETLFGPRYFRIEPPTPSKGYSPEQNMTSPNVDDDITLTQILTVVIGIALIAMCVIARLIWKRLQTCVANAREGTNN